MRHVLLAFTILAASSSLACAQNEDNLIGGGGNSPADMPATQPAVPGSTNKLPYITVDVKHKQVRVDCEALNVDIPLEFFLVANGGNEHESVLRSPVKPQNLHLALLMLGLKPGEPLRYSDAKQSWLPPYGPPLHISCEFVKDGHKITVPASRLMRSVKTKKEMPSITFVFTGSKIMEDGTYAADSTGYLVSICNFDLTVIDVPELVSSANETLEWEVNPDLVPKRGTPVTMIIEPVGAENSGGAAPSGNDANPPTPATPDAPATQSSAANSPDTANVVVDSAGTIQLNMKEISLDKLTSTINDLKAGGISRVRITAAKDVDPGLAKKVQDAVTATQLPAAYVGDSGAADVGHAPLSDVHIDEQKMTALEKRWEQEVAPHDKALRDAAQAHYEVMEELRREQQRLIDEADRIQRVMDDLTKKYQDMTTPRPSDTP